MRRLNLFIFNFKAEIIFFTKLLALLLVLLVAALIMVPQFSTGYNASIIDKIKRLKSITEPKIVLLGNSNLAFGIQSELLQKAFNMPVVNMGLHGGLGNEFHERIGCLNVHKGDIYILCHSDYANQAFMPNRSLLWITLENHLDLWQLLRPNERIKMIEALPKYLQSCFRDWLLNRGNRRCDTSSYSRLAFNQYGDNIYDDEGQTFNFENVEITLPQVGSECAARINKLNEFFEQRGARLLIAGYPIARVKQTRPKEEYVKFQKKLEAEVDCPVISNFTDYFYSPDCFFNTCLHLNKKGKRLRTEQLIKDLKRCLMSDGHR